MILLRWERPCSFSSCGSTTEIIGEWSEDEYKTGSIDKLLILGIVDQKKPLLKRRLILMVLYSLFKERLLDNLRPIKTIS